jgi:hypothetical protein
LENIVEKMESQNMKLFSMMQDLTHRVSRLDTPNEPPQQLSQKLSRRKSEPQLTERNLALGILNMNNRRISIRRRTSLRSNVTSLSASSALSDDRLVGVPLHINARRPSHLTDTTDLTEDFEEFDAVDFETPTNEKTDSPLFFNRNSDQMNKDSPSNSSSPSKLLKLNLSVPSDESMPTNVSSPTTAGLPQTSKPVSSLARLWQMGAPFETIVEEEPDTATIRSAVHENSDMSSTVSDKNLNPEAVGAKKKRRSSKNRNNSHRESYDNEAVDSRLRIEHQKRASGASGGSHDHSEFGMRRGSLESAEISNAELVIDNEKSEEDEDVTVACDAHPQFMQCPYLEGDIIPVNEETSALDEVVDELISMIQPHEEQIAYRGSVQAVVTRFARRMLGTRMIESGLHAIRCFLPDDVLRLGVFLPPSSKQAATWANMLCDKLNKLSEGDVVAVDDYEDMKLSSFFTDTNSFAIIGDHQISGVTTQNPNSHLSPVNADPLMPTSPTPPATPQPGPFFPSTSSSVQSSTAAASNNVNGNNTHNNSLSVIPTQRVHLALDSVQVEIVSNPKLDVVTLALLEEMSQLIGKDHLFKRSLLLIRAWWMYETTAYVGTPIKHYLSDMSMALMVAALFNVHHARFHQPLQVLTAFLAEYSQVNWETHAITLQGVVPFHEIGSGFETEPCFARIASSHLLSKDLLKKYLEILYLQPLNESPTRDSPTVLSGGGRSAGGSSHHSHHSNHSGGNSHHSNNNSAANALLASSSDDASCEEYQCASTVNHIKLFRKYTRMQVFEKGALNIVHPLTLVNMVPRDYINQRRLNKIVKAFESGAKSMGTTLKLAGKGSVSVHMPVNSFFRGICSRFGTGWRPDVVANSLVLSKGMAKQQTKGKVVGSAANAKSPDSTDNDGSVLTEKFR